MPWRVWRCFWPVPHDGFWSAFTYMLKLSVSLKIGVYLGAAVYLLLKEAH